MASARSRFPFIAFLLIGCGTTPIRPLPMDVADAAVVERVTATSETIQQLEATVLRDPAPVEVPTLTLAEAIEWGMRSNPRLKVAAANAARAVGREAVAFAPFLPEVDLFTRMGATSPTLSPGAPGPVGGIEGSLESTHAFAQAELGVQWMLNDFGRTAGRYNQAVSHTHIADMQLARAKQTVAFDVSTAYVRVLLAKATAAEQNQAVLRAEAVLRDTKARRDNGDADKDLVLRAEVQLAESKEARVLAREMEFDSLARLNNAMGRNASLPVKVIDWKDAPRIESNLVECLETAVTQRLEVRIVREAVAAAQSGLEAVDADFKPKVYVLAGVGRVEGSGIQTGWQEGVGIHLNQKIFAGGRRRGESAAARSDVAAAAGMAQSVFDNIALEVEVAYRRLHATKERIELAEPAVEQARENRRLVEVKYRNGNATPTDIVDAETALTRAAQRLNFARYDHLAAIARLEYALGGQPGSLLEAAQPAEAKP